MPSFLQKLTGTLQADEAEEFIDQDALLKNKLNNQKFMPNTKENIETGIQNQQEGEWLPESEGQLTVDVYQTTSEIVIKSTIAGVSPEDLDVAITNDMVTIKGKREREAEAKSEDYYYQECYWGAFSRSIILPVDVEAEKAQATMKNGILTIRLPKIEKVKTKKIKVISG